LSSVLLLVALAALAVAAAVLLERGGRGGYGWVTGSEFALAGLGLGPLGLDAVSSDLTAALQPAIGLAVCWLGLRFGLRLRPSALASIPRRTRVAALVEPLATLLLLRLMLEGVVRWAGLDLDGHTAWALAAVGSATTKSATAWARAQLGAQGGLFDALEAVSTLDDVVLIVVAGVLVPRLVPGAAHLPAGGFTPVLATLTVGAALAVLLALLVSHAHFRADIGWIALFGVCGLGAGLSGSLGLSAVTVTALCGAIVGLASPYADALDELTRSTERPAVLVLLLLGGASLHPGWTALALGGAAAVLRALAKLLGGALSSPLLPPGARRAGWGAGLLGAGGIAFAVAVALASQLGPSGQVLLSGAVVMALLGDFLGSPLLRALLTRAGELPPPPAAPEPAP
jgi:hypothetical protein